MADETPDTHREPHGSSAPELSPSPDLHDRITQAYFGGLGHAFEAATRQRIHWICTHAVGARVLDVGCSQGISAILLGREGKEVTGIDVSERCIAQAMEYLAQEPRHVQAGVSFIHGEFLTHDFRDTRFDTVIMGEVLEHLLEPEAFVTRAWQLVAEGGQIVVTVPFGINDWRDHKHTFYLLRPLRILSRHFDITEIEWLGRWLGFAGRARARRRSADNVRVSQELLSELEAAFLRRERSLLDQNSALGRAREALEARLQEAGRSIAVSREEADATERRLSADRSRLREENARLDAGLVSLVRRLSDLEADIAQRSAKLEAARAELAEEHAERAAADQRAAALSEERDALQARLDQLRAAYEEADRKAVRFEALLEVARADAEAHKDARTAADQRVDELSRQRRITAEEVEAIRSNEQAERAKSDRLRLQLQAAGTRSSELRDLLDSTQHQLELAESQVDRAKNMIAFQLGDALIRAGKSWRALAELPKRLREISRDAKSRRQRATSGRQIEPPTGGQSNDGTVTRSQPHLAATFSSPAVLGKPVRSADDLRALKIACIMDDFAFACFDPEARFVQLSPGSWRDQLESLQPDLLFIESAWRGKDEAWKNAVHRSSEIADLAEWCRRHDVPSVFWNKEDPVHFDTFIRAASLFDYVFTTDIDCVARYKAALRHDRVYLLPFACQPRLFNPIETCGRMPAVSFAGSYYTRYPERIRDLETFLAALGTRFKIDIYDRNYGQDDPRYMFPQKYAPYIVGHLPFDQIQTSYKEYLYAINMNSIKQSQSMFARRVFELLACNTVSISNFSRGLRLLFGDLVICSDNGEEVLRRLDALDDDVSLRKFRLLGLRKVMLEHTAQDRLAHVVSKIQDGAVPDLHPCIVMIGCAQNQAQLDALMNSYRRQTYAKRRLCVVRPDDFAPDRLVQDDTVRIVSMSEIATENMAALAGDATYIAGMAPDDYYGPNYLCDLALATRYTDAAAIGKATCFVREPGRALGIENPGHHYRTANDIPARCALVKISHVAETPIGEWVQDIDSRRIEAAALSIDEFNYCRNGAAASADDALRETVDDLRNLWSGLNIEAINRRVDEIPPEERQWDDEATVVSGAELASLLKSRSSNFSFVVEGSDWCIESRLPDGKHEYIYAPKMLTPSEIGLARGGKLRLETSPGVNVRLTLIYFDETEQRIGHEIKPANRNETCTPPEGAAYIKLGLRLSGSGRVRIKALANAHRAQAPSILLGKARNLLLTNEYPEYERLYRNGFVHSRVSAYASQGMSMDVFRLRPGAPVRFHEFQGVDVITGPEEALNRLLSDGCYESVAVHFLTKPMWDILERHINRTKIVVWVHGSEVQPWWRRNFDHASEDDSGRAVRESEARVAFWRGLLTDFPRNLHLVFVSRHFAEEVMQDLEIRVPEDRYSVIHNPIDTDLFACRPKTADQRRKVLSIRPYASRKYANDLTVEAILALKDNPNFGDIQFHLIGDGPLFDETVAPLRGLPNVRMERKFLTRQEIAELHTEYGVFLTPSRIDSQGVSRDEAMSSGLVPITNRVAAIPEFVDEECGMLADPEDADGIAAAIIHLYENPDRFLALSEGAAKRVRRQSASSDITGEELQLLVGSPCTSRANGR